MMRKQLDRRTFVRGMLGAGVVSVALPPLDAMMNLEQTVFADGGSTRALRYVAWMFGNGFMLKQFEPSSAGPNWQLSPHLQPLAAVKSYLNLVTGLRNRAKTKITHHEGMTVWSGYTMRDIGQGQGFYSNTGGPTLDHLISQAIGEQVPISGVHLGASKAQSPADNGTTMHALSSRGYLQPNAPITNPSAAWAAVFGSFMGVEPNLELRSSILDATKAEVATLSSKLGPADKIRLEAHLDSVAALQAKLAATIPICTLPADPQMTNSEVVNTEQLTRVNELMSDLITYAFRCDLSRVATMLFLEGAAEPILSEVPGSESSWHGYSHKPQGWTPDSPFERGQRYMMSRLAYLLEQLQGTVEFDGSNLLDNSIVLMSSDCSDGSNHSVERQPMLVAGGGGGHLAHPGVHYQPAPLHANHVDGQVPWPSSGNTSDLLLAILQAFDPSATWIGEALDEQGEGAGSGSPLVEILAGAAGS